MPPLMRRIFWFINKFFMVPMFRLGLGPFFGNPFTGYIMVMKITGRKTGKIRYAPVNYAIHNGSIYCISGGRQTSDWYRNLKANPQLEIILPSGAVYGTAEETDAPQDRNNLVRQVLKNAGFAGFFEGYNPFTISDADLQTRAADLPLLRITPTGLGSGASDPAGWAWIWIWIFFAILIYALVR